MIIKTKAPKRFIALVILYLTWKVQLNETCSSSFLIKKHDFSIRKRGQELHERIVEALVLACSSLSLMLHFPVAK